MGATVPFLAAKEIEHLLLTHGSEVLERSEYRFLRNNISAILRLHAS